MLLLLLTSGQIQISRYAADVVFSQGVVAITRFPAPCYVVEMIKKLDEESKF